jgi:crotonobetainyl-CoA:carnitine CoA-transferase CaiB-like acyl-CoA transferase
MAHLPLSGIRVTDFTWIGAGSYTTKILADAGADVVKIESSDRIDSLRLAAPYKDGIKGVNRSGYFADRNSSKRSLTLNMKHPRALGLVSRLLVQSDVISNNFTPGVMDRFGLGYDAVREIKPNIIYLAMSMQGGSGPQKHYLGYGATMAAVTGIQQLTGLPGREPAGTGTNYPDHIPNPCHAAFAVLAALRHRRRTGEGQRIDMAQTEPTVAQRLARADDIDAQLNSETQGIEVEELVERLQRHGVPAGRVSTAADVVRDPQLAHRNHWLTLNHLEMGPSLYNAQPFRYSRSSAGEARPAPLLGQHTQDICRELLGLDGDDIAQLVSDGALT